MPRKSRIDTPGALHHIIARGIERGRIFAEDTDRDDFFQTAGNDSVGNTNGVLCMGLDSQSFSSAGQNRQNTHINRHAAAAERIRHWL